MTAQQLKNSILQMAVQGKLVPQNPDDEPASVLLERIKAEKQELMKAGKIKKDKKSSEIFRGASRNFPYNFCEQIGKEIRDVSDEIPFEIPESWEWCRWGELSESIQYGYNAPAKENGRIKMVRISDIQDNRVLWESVPYCDIEEKIISTYLLRPNDILFARTGGTVGKSYLVKSVPEQAIYAGYLIRTRYSNSLCPEYLKFFMESELYWTQLRSGTIATAQPNCNGKALSNMLVPVPPLAEQHRIVAKIEELLPYIEQYEQAETKLAKLNADFPEALKKSILQEAVQGRLVPQNPDDEPASVLLERIKAEKQALIKAGKIKKSKHESTIVTLDKIPYEISDGKEHCIAHEVPFEIPDTWEWVRLGSICKIARGGSPRPIKQFLTEEPDGINWVKISDSDKGGKYINSTKEKIKPEGMSKSRFVHAGDFLLTNSMSFGRPYILNVDGCIHDGWLVLGGYQTAYDKDFLFYMLSSDYAYYQFCNVVSGAVVKNLNSDKVSNALFPLPPFVEQKRIVERIEELMKYCKML